jgi:hypothetical protein
MTIKIQKGRILIYRVYDIGEEIDLEKADRILSENPTTRSKFKLKKINQNAVIVSNDPLSIGLNTCQFTFQNVVYNFELSAKVWEFGTISLTYEWQIPKGCDLRELLKNAIAIFDEDEIDQHARTKAREVASQIKDSMGKLSEWETNEDYLLYFIEEFETPIPDASSLLEAEDVAHLIFLEETGGLSKSATSRLYDGKLQYFKNDLALLDWNSGFIVEPTGSMDIPDVVEFALNQLLEMRYYDELLDKKLKEIYSAIELKELSIFSSRYYEIALEAGQKYIEIAEIVENVENSLKAIGDVYHSVVYRMCSNKFRFKDWQSNIDNKLDNLADISKMLLENINNRRSHLLELIVIFLIGLELLPLLEHVKTFFK